MKKNVRRSLYQSGDLQRHHQAHQHAQRQSVDIGRSPFRQDVINLTHSPAFRRLAGKTQLFPSYESDLFRNRLTHTIEVAQIARDIAVRLNREPFFANSVKVYGDMQIDQNLVEFAGLAHDIGHPPFGHTGEKTLDEMMLEFGGFEGNAQTLRIVCVLIRRNYPNGIADPTQLVHSTEGDRRLGLNLTFRSIASVLKYDHCIEPKRNKGAKVSKGYYLSEEDIVKRTKDMVLGDYTLEKNEKFRTIECDIMDVADDIAYSTYDIEDSLQAGVLRAADFLYPRPEVLSAVCQDMDGLTDDEKSREKIRRHLKNFADGVRKFVDEQPVNGSAAGQAELTPHEQEEQVYKASELLTRDAHIRTQFVTWWIQHLINSLVITPREDCPPLTKIELPEKIREQVETLKKFVFQKVTLSAPLQTSNFRGERIVGSVFKAIEKYKYKLLPVYERDLLRSVQESDLFAQRILCDYMAGMTDEFASFIFEQLMSGNAAKTVNHQLYY